MLHHFDLHAYQVRAVQNTTLYPRYMLHMDMSLGKTVCVLTAAADLLDYGQTYGVLVVAPKRVAEAVWAQEAAKWSHTAHLSVCVLRGRNKRLLARELVRRHHIYVINYESLPWLAAELNQLFLARGRHLPFDMLVLDEITRAKNPEGQRISVFYAQDEDDAQLIDHFPRRIGLTGTPAPNGYWDLFGQYLAIDDTRLGRLRNIYKEQYFDEDPYTGRLSLLAGAKEKIEKRITPITLSMRAEDYLELPDYIYNDLWIDLPPKVREQYDQLEETMFAEFEGQTLELFNAVSLTAKCRQIASGILIDSETGAVSKVHDAKLEALDEILEEAAGQPVLCSYVFRADMERIRSRYKRSMPAGYIGPGVSDRNALQIISDWNAGRIQLLLLHHASGGHGLNLQHGGHQIVWFGLDWPLEGWLQLNARLRRQGQTASAVIVHRILARSTIDEAVKDRLAGKQQDQDDLRAAMHALQEYAGRRGAPLQHEK